MRMSELNHKMHKKNVFLTGMAGKRLEGSDLFLLRPSSTPDTVRHSHEIRKTKPGKGPGL